MEQYLKIPTDKTELSKVDDVYDWFYELVVLRDGVGEEFELRELEIFALMLTLGREAIYQKAGEFVKRPDFDYDMN